MVRLQQMSHESTIFWEGDEGDGLYIVDDGIVNGWVLDRKLFYRPLSRELGVGSVFGEIAFFLGAKRTATM